MPSVKWSYQFCCFQGFFFLLIYFESGYNISSVKCIVFISFDPSFRLIMENIDFCFRKVYIASVFLKSGCQQSCRTKSPFGVGLSGQTSSQSNVRNHLHTGKSIEGNPAHHRLMLPWETKQKSPLPSCTQRLSHTFWHVCNPNKTKTSCWERLESAARPLCWAFTHLPFAILSALKIQTNVNTPFKMHVHQCLRCSWSETGPYSHMPPCCNGEGTGTLITLWHSQPHAGSACRVCFTL